MSAEPQAVPRVGARFILKGERGTVRFVGPVPPASGTWLGVEWDNAARGKHDGVSADGTRYFECRQPGAGSFIRPSGKVKLDYGVSFIQALRSRYALVPTFNVVDTQEKAKHSRKNLAEIEIEVPNVDALFQKELVLDRLRIVAVGSRSEPAASEDKEEHTLGRGLTGEPDTEAEVSRAFDASAGEQVGDIRKAIPNVKELDMSRSLLPTWEEAGLITRELPWLDTLLLHFNRFAPLTAAPPTDTFPRIRHLGLDGTLITWQEILTLSSSLPCLERLELRRNRLKRLFDPEAGNNTESANSHPTNDTAGLERLQSLHLQENELSDWHDLVAALTPLPSLQQLVLSSNRFRAIATPGQAETKRFSCLKDIALDRNPLSAWSDVDAVAAWCCSAATDESRSSQTLDPLETSTLSSLFISNENDTGTFVEGLDSRDVRAIVIARLPTLQHVNGTLVRPAERRDAELWYLGRVAEERLNDSTLKSTHPRFEALSLAHAFTKEDSEKRAHVEETDTLRSRLLELHVHTSAVSPPNLSEAESKGTVNLLGTSALRTCTAKIAKACGVKGRDIKELWAALAPASSDEPDPDGAEGRIVVSLDNASRELGWYGVQNGDHLLVVL